MELGNAGTEMQCEPIRIELRGEPQGKGRPRFVRATGHAFTPNNTRSYESHLRLAAQDAMGSRPPIEGAVRLDVVARLPVPRSWSKKKQAAALLGLILPTGKRDWDNYGKVASDALNCIVYRDDAQIIEATVCKRYSDRPALIITVQEIFSSANSCFLRSGQTTTNPCEVEMSE